MQTTAIRTVANPLPENEVILLTLLIPKRYIPYTDLHKNYAADFVLGESGGYFNRSLTYSIIRLIADSSLILEESIQRS